MFCYVYIVAKIILLFSAKSRDISILQLHLADVLTCGYEE